MKKFKYLALATVVALGMTSCGDFGDTNIDPEHLNEGNVPYEMIFSNAQHQALGSDWDMWRTGCIYSAQWTQQMASIAWWWPYGMYYWQDGYNASFWDTYSGDRGAMRDVTTCCDLWASDEAHIMDCHIANVMRVYAFCKMSDLYGDVPYSQAGYPSTYSYPEYDKQEDIYADAFNQLNTAQAVLSGTAEMGSHDLYYSGDCAKWKKFANSLMLRLAMRCVKVDPALAKQWAEKAYANGVMESIDDDCMLMHSGGVTTNDSAEPFAKINAHEDREFYLSNVFVDMLKNTGDPRLCMIGCVSEGANQEQTKDIQSNSGGTWTAADYGDMSFDIQHGMPVGGYKEDTSAGEFYVGNADPFFDTTAASGKKVIEEYSSHISAPNRCTYCDPTGPTFVVTYAQTCFLLAEAAQRGFSVGADAKTWYERGVVAAFNQFSHFPNVSAALKVALTMLQNDPNYTQDYNGLAKFYLANNPFDSSKALEQINTQYYINTFGDPHEVFANWRRSGYPVLTPAVMAPKYESASTTKIPRRFSYPQSEAQVNKANYDAAVARQGADTYDTRMWWDKE